MVRVVKTLKVKLDTAYYCNGLCKTLYPKALTGLARAFNNSSTEIWKKNTRYVSEESKFFWRTEDDGAL